MSANKVVFHSALKELRIILCQKSKSSQGTRDFIEKYYVPIKTANPTIPVLIRECSNVEPKIFARYERGKEVHAVLSNENSEGVLKRVTEFASRSS